MHNLQSTTPSILHKFIEKIYTQATYFNENIITVLLSLEPTFSVCRILGVRKDVGCRNHQRSQDASSSARMLTSLFSALSVPRWSLQMKREKQSKESGKCAKCKRIISVNTISISCKINYIVYAHARAQGK